MAHEPTAEDVVDVLERLKALGAIPALAEITEASRRTLYHHVGDDVEERPGMSGRTFFELAALFSELGIIEDRSFGAMSTAVREIRRRATLLADEADAADEGDDPVGSEARGGGPGPAA